MIETVETLEQAREWFLSHSTGEVNCVRPDGTEKVVSSYPEAEAFFSLPTKMPIVIDSHQLACELYSRYCEDVGGKAFNGDPLPSWADFSIDPKKQVQVDAWIRLAKNAKFLLGIPID